jgi:hypothetical protein
MPIQISITSHSLIQIPVRRFIGEFEIETEIENLLTLWHPIIAPPIGFALPGESSGRRELKTTRLHAAEGSLAAVFSALPARCAHTAKAKAVAGIAVALRFVHSVGLLHGCLQVSNVLFDADLRIQIVDFSPISLETGTIEAFSGDGWSPTMALSAFVSLSLEIAVGCSAI